MLVEAPIVFGVMIVGAVRFGVTGAAWGQLIDQTVMIVLWFLILRSALAARDRTEGVSAPAGTRTPSPS
jgi:hypothetical protein